MEIIYAVLDIISFFIFPVTILGFLSGWATANVKRYRETGTFLTPVDAWIVKKISFGKIDPLPKYHKSQHKKRKYKK